MNFIVDNDCEETIVPSDTRRPLPFPLSLLPVYTPLESTADNRFLRVIYVLRAPPPNSRMYRLTHVYDVHDGRPLPHLTPFLPTTLPLLSLSITMPLPHDLRGAAASVPISNTDK